MRLDVDKALGWIRTNVEIGFVVSILTGAVTYVGRCYYGSYFDFYSIPSGYVDTSLFDNIMISVAVAIFSLSLIGMVYRSQDDKSKGFWASIHGNVPLFVVLLLA